MYISHLSSDDLSAVVLSHSKNNVYWPKGCSVKVGNGLKLNFVSFEMESTTNDSQKEADI